MASFPVRNACRDVPTCDRFGRKQTSQRRFHEHSWCWVPSRRVRHPCPCQHDYACVARVMSCRSRRWSQSRRARKSTSVHMWPVHVAEDTLTWRVDRGDVHVTTCTSVHLKRIVRKCRRHVHDTEAHFLNIFRPVLCVSSWNNFLPWDEKWYGSSRTSRTASDAPVKSVLLRWNQPLSHSNGQFVRSTNCC